MMISSNAQPRHWTAFRAVGMHEPRRPSGARSKDHRGDPGIRPDQACRPDHRVPDQASDENRESASRSVRAGTRRAPMTRTSSETPRFPRAPAGRRARGCGRPGDRVDAPGGRPVVHLGGARGRGRALRPAAGPNRRRARRRVRGRDEPGTRRPRRRGQVPMPRARGGRGGG